MDPICLALLTHFLGKAPSSLLRVCLYSKAKTSTMITIKTRAECMTNLVPAASVPAEKRFVAFLDASSNPALFSLSNAGQLNLILDHNRIPTVADFGQKIGLDDDHAVVAFDARQTSDGRISIAVATDQGGGNYGLRLVSAMAPGDLEQDKLPDSAIICNSKPLPTIYEVYMMCAFPDLGCLLVLIHNCTY